MKKKSLMDEMMGNAFKFDKSLGLDTFSIPEVTAENLFGGDFTATPKPRVKSNTFTKLNKRKTLVQRGYAPINQKELLEHEQYTDKDLFNSNLSGRVRQQD